MLTSLRAQVNAALAEVPVQRRPALRRSDDPCALLATDLPLVTDADELSRFVRRLEAMGWRVQTAPNGWLLLDRDVPVPELVQAQAPEGECGCCISLLQRHQEGGAANDLIRSLVKATEAGKQPFERFCAGLHARLAALLRQRQPLPDALLPYLCSAYSRHYDRR